jgi:hypothetical protein
MRRQCPPQALWHFEKAAALGRSLSGASRERWTSLLDRTGGAQVMSIELARPIERRQNVLALA